MTEPTPSLDEFRKAYEADDNQWWMLSSGDHMNLFDEALDRIAELEAAQRPPSGYAVTVDDGSGGRWMQAGAVLPTLEEAVSRALFYRPADARAVELREMQP